MSDPDLITALRVALGRKRKGDGGLATQRRVARLLKVHESRISDVLRGARKLTEAARGRAERRLAG